MVCHAAIQSEFYKEFLAETPKGRDVKADAMGAELPDEKIYNVEEGLLKSSNFVNPMRLRKTLSLKFLVCGGSYEY